MKTINKIKIKYKLCGKKSVKNLRCASSIFVDKAKKDKPY